MPQRGLVLAAEGFVLNLGLLLAVGAQASFVLRQGLARQQRRVRGRDLLLVPRRPGAA